jgi:hypothetical protein
MNFSEGREPGPVEDTDGNSHWTQYIDWSASQHDVLYVVSGSQESDLVGIPQDNFNGITVAASTFLEEGGEWGKEASFNAGFVFDAEGDRVSTDLLAPGEDIFLTFPNNVEDLDFGTSYAAPHVTGAAALLHQYANQQITAGTPRWGNEAHFHEVTKAILLNSADKLDGVHGSTREVVNTFGGNWLGTFAATQADVSLDANLGAGHLNVSSAITNFGPGEYDPGSTPVPPIGWDFGSIGAFGTLDYTFDQTVSGYVAITLAWDRRVELTDPDNSYSFGDQFFRYNEIDETQNNLDVLLLNDSEQVIASSTTADDNLEHIFQDVPAGQYKIRVSHVGGLLDAQDYALAWWAGEAAPPVQPGDYDLDSDVDGRDFLVWQRGNSPNPLSATDLAAWQANYGTGGFSAVSAPEPTAMAALLLSIVALTNRREFMIAEF